MYFRMEVCTGISESIKKFEFEYNDIEELKTGILKRIGNIRGTNKAEKEKPELKRRIKACKSLEELVSLFNYGVGSWEIMLRF